MVETSYHNIVKTFFVNGPVDVSLLRICLLSEPDDRGENMPMTLTELSVYMKEQEQLRIEKEREDGMN